MTFLPGLELCRRFHDEAVRPILAARFPGLRYAAARIGRGSDVLGLDTARSMDHDWGPRLLVFLDPATIASTGGEVDAALAAGLPATFLGLPARFSAHQDTASGVLDPAGERHGCTVTTLDRWFAGQLGFDPRTGPNTFDWLATPTQRLAEVTGGAVFHDGLDGALETARRRLRWYPDDVWRYVLACQWTRVGQEEHLAGRAADVGDELGSAVLAARLARDLARLALLLARTWPPYGKWLGTALARLPTDTGGGLAADLAAAITAPDWPTREDHLCRAYERVAAAGNATGLARPVDPRVRPFHDRPFRVLDAGRFATALTEAITDPTLRGLPPVGAVDQYLDNTDVLCHTARTRAVAGALTPLEVAP